MNLLLPVFCGTSFRDLSSTTLETGLLMCFLVRPRHESDSLRHIGLAEGIQPYGVPFFPPHRVDLVRLTLDQAWLVNSTSSGGLKLSFPTDIEARFGPYLALRATISAQLEIATLCHQGAGCQCLRHKVIQALLKMCVSHLRLQLLQSCRTHFRQRQELVPYRGDGDCAPTRVQALLGNMKDGLKRWTQLDARKRLRFSCVPFVLFSAPLFLTPYPF